VSEATERRWEQLDGRVSACKVLSLLTMLREMCVHVYVCVCACVRVCVCVYVCVCTR
jgi:hypothetical protein